MPDKQPVDPMTPNPNYPPTTIGPQNPVGNQPNPNNVTIPAPTQAPTKEKT